QLSAVGRHRPRPTCAAVRGGAANYSLSQLVAPMVIKDRIAAVALLALAVIVYLNTNTLTQSSQIVPNALAALLALLGVILFARTFLVRRFVSGASVAPAGEEGLDEDEAEPAA